ncbi:MAG TPA: hypothetical protein VK763_15245 [Terriglobales bacterium]|jgi:hypothetical protein|nr:hypothetical protein [Terriglobales bacterium]
MLAVNPFSSHVAARIFDFFNAATQWHRRLWCVGVSLTIAEVLEGSEATRQGLLSMDSLRALSGSAMAAAGVDPGTGGTSQKQLLQQAMRPDLRFSGLDYLTVRDLQGDIEAHYLERWASTLNNTQSCPGPERTARSIAAHLLDLGFSSDYLHRWWTYKVKHEGGSRNLHDLVSDAHQLATSPKPKFEVLLAFEEIPRTKELPPRWLDAPSVSGWLRKQGFETSGVRQKGGMLVTEEARDAISAIEAAQETLDRLAARVALGVRGNFKPVDTAWVAGGKSPIKISPRRRAIQIHSLHREDQIYSDAEPSKVDAAIELLAPLAFSSPSAAVSGGWAAVEALLSEPNDRASAASRMASLVACSFPRAELTPLSYKLEEAGGPLSARLHGLTKNRDRCELVAAAIANGDQLSFDDDSDTAALGRLRTLLAAPHIKLKDIESHLEAAFRRLYRQRNLVLHGGKTSAVALRACVRTIAPLVGAGMDRIAHAWFVEKITPLELAARARIRLSLLEEKDGIKSVDLLS